MDEEDLAAMKEEQKLETKEGFGVEGRKGKGKAGTEERFVRRSSLQPLVSLTHHLLFSSSSCILRD